MRRGWDGNGLLRQSARGWAIIGFNIKVAENCIQNNARAYGIYLLPV